MRRWIFAIVFASYIIALTGIGVDAAGYWTKDRPNEPCTGYLMFDGLFCSLPTPNYFTFGNLDGEVGKLSWETGTFVFTGNVDKSAKAFLTHFNALCKELGEK